MVPALSAAVGQGAGLLEPVLRVTWQNEGLNEDRRRGEEVGRRRGNNA